ncbi:MAG: EAL domain-containing protein [Gammaproteobacteria bacterium]|nr:EAL domain-containing protein [Gammaproteobacteria bacterium]
MSTVSACVLAVDDNATIRRAIAMRLSSKGYRVVTAEDGREALSAIEREPFDLVLLDLQMPGMSGAEVLKNLRLRYSETQLPVIMLAASDDKHDIAHTMELGANDYVVKPGDLPILLARINTQLALKKAADRLRAKEGLSDVANPLQAAGASPTLLEDSLLQGTTHFLYDNTPVACWILNSSLEVLLTNRFSVQTLGYLPTDVQQQPVLDFYPSEDQPRAGEYLQAALEHPDRLHRWEIRRRKKNAESMWVKETARVVTSRGVPLILLTVEDIDEAFRLSEKLNFHAAHDELTGLPNRKTLEDRLGRVLESAHSESSEHTLGIIDIDQFRILNDTCGHAAGDELLRQIARLLKTISRKRDTLARIGGDDFAMLIEDCPLRLAMASFEAVRAAVEAFQFVWNERSYKVSLSIGLVAVNRSCDSVAEVMSMADTACYAAKDAGRNRLHTYEVDDAKMLTRHGQMRWATRINDALRDNRFELFLQPIVPIVADGSGDHYEILLRMRDERGQLVMPSEFLPAAERYNLAVKIDRWVVNHTLSWLRDHPRLLQRLHLCAINLSGQSFGNDDCLSFILERIDSCRIPAHKLCFEVTETAAVSDIVQASRFIQTLQERGCLFALDDFGSGFSSFAYLKNLPVDFLKIDGAFVRGIAVDSVDLAMVKSINEIGHLMGKRTVAEFVEDEPILRLLRALGVDYAQGYGVGKPVPLLSFVNS